MSDEQYELIMKRLDNIEKRLNMESNSSDRKQTNIAKVVVKILLYILAFVVLYNVFTLILWKFKPDNDMQTNQIASFVASVFFTSVIAYSVHERNKDKEDHD